MTPLSDIASYNTNMRKSLSDKLWWLDKVDENISTVIDYGCADGALLEAISISNPQAKLYGYDFSPDMVEIANRNLEGKAFISEVYSQIVAKADVSAAVLSVSSVFHEIMNYSPVPQDDFDRIFGIGIKYIAIRDMFVSEKAFYKSDEENLRAIRANYSANMLDEFEHYIGSLEENQNLLQFCLTYRYKINWKREVRENYFPYTIEEFMKMIPSSYEPIYFEHYILPFAKESVERDFGFTIHDNTHGKILLRKKHEDSTAISWY